MTSADDVELTWQMTSPRADVSRRNPGACWRVTESDDAWRRVTDLGGAWWRVSCCADSFGGAWELRWWSGFHEMVDRRRKILVVPAKTQSEQGSRDSEWRRLQVRNQRRWLKRVRGLTANGCSSSCKGRSNCESKIISIRTWLPRKSQNDGSGTMLEILEDLYCIS